jgi:hypothetical protein
VELYGYSLWAAPVGLAIATVELIWHRRLLPLLLGLGGVLLGGLVGRVAWEWFADPPIGFEFGSEFEGLDWVVGFASVGGLIGVLAGVWLSIRRHRRHSAAVRQGIGVKNSDHPCDLRLRPIWPPVRSARIAFREARVRTPPPTELAEI